jgi:hypothetical protein
MAGIWGGGGGREMAGKPEENGRKFEKMAGKTEETEGNLRDETDG